MGKGASHGSSPGKAGCFLACTLACAALVSAEVSALQGPLGMASLRTQPSPAVTCECAKNG
jgi:hypothetical protein